MARFYLCENHPVRCKEIRQSSLRLRAKGGVVSPPVFYFPLTCEYQIHISHLGIFYLFSLRQQNLLLHCADSRLVRKAPAAYDDGVYMMSGKNRYLCTEVEFWYIGTKFLRVFPTGRQLRPLSSVLYRIIPKRRYILAAQLLLREKSGT
jgi:hypothetical protein